MVIETYEQAVHFWNSRVNYEKAGMPQDLRALNLDRMRLMLQLLGNPQESYRIIHVTGTKGKGSTAAILAGILQTAGYRTGLYTSPHLTMVEERVQIDGQAISQDDLTVCMQAVAKICEQVERQESAPTFFEIITAVGLLYFSQRQVTWAVLEVGLGGRFDATNVCLPEVSVITSISLDHMEQLGDTVEKIAYEKAGIIKSGRPVVTGVREAGPWSVIKSVADRESAELHSLGKDFDRKWQPGNPVTGELPQIKLLTSGRKYPSLPLGLWGKHQADNAAVALWTLEVLRSRGLELPNEALPKGLKQVRIPGRLEIVGRSPWLIIDCAHNEASIQALIDWLGMLPSKDRYLLFAVSKDKQIGEMLQLLKGRFTEICFTRYSSSARGADPHMLLSLWKEVGGEGGCVFDSAVAGWKRLKELARSDDLVCVTGSVFLAGEVRQVEL